MNKKGSVAVFVILFLVSLSVLGLVLFKFGYFDSTNQAGEMVIPGNASKSVDQQSAEIKKVEPGDDVVSIDKDLSNTNLNTLDQEVLGIKTESDSL
jgi:hypothetical protein